MDKKELRKEKIGARNALGAERRTAFSKAIADQIRRSREYRNAKTVMIYKAIGGEVSLAELERDEKVFVYPLCVSDTEMIGLRPLEDTAWQKGYHGILEPIRERSEEILPEQIDLILCPCTVFDEQGGRIGMGAGFYDRYLRRCTHAVVAAVAFSCQKAEKVPMEDWDQKMEIVFTEDQTYRIKKN